MLSIVSLAALIAQCIFANPSFSYQTWQNVLPDEMHISRAILQTDDIKPVQF
jgi:hypothetical protein